MSLYKYILQKNSPLYKAVQHVLQLFSVPSDSVVAEGECFAVNDSSSVVHVGILPILSALRTTTDSADLRAFLGSDFEMQALVNQWVAMALLLSADAVDQRVTGCTTTFAKHVFAELERKVEDFALQKSFLAGTPRATVADLLLHAAICGHPCRSAEVLPSTLAWLLHAQTDAYLAPILDASALRTAAALATSESATNSRKKGFAKPSEEEIMRRRQEKEEEKERQAKLEQADGAAALSSLPSVKDTKAQKKGQKNQQKDGEKVTKEKQSFQIDPNSLDVRVGRFTNVHRHPDADRLYIEEMDLGLEKRTIVSGLVGHYKAEELEGMLCLAVCNMKPKPLKGVTSHGMVLCAQTENIVRILPPPNGAKPGDRIMFADEFNLDAVSEPKQLSNNLMSELIGSLRTDAEGVLRWRDVPAQHCCGEVKIPEAVNSVVK